MAENNARAYAQVVKAFLASKKAIDGLENKLFEARKSQLERIREACANLQPVSEPDFEKDWRKPIETELEPHYASKEVMRVQVSYIKTAVIAFTNGIAIDPSKDTNLQAFVSRVRPILKEQGLLKGNNRSKSDGTNSPKKENAREQSLKLLAVDKHGLDAEQVRERMAALNYILQNFGWDPIINLANELKAQEPEKQAA